MKLDYAADGIGRGRGQRYVQVEIALRGRGPENGRLSESELQGRLEGVGIPWDETTLGRATIIFSIAGPRKFF